MTTERVERRLAAILSADVVGYSSLMRADEKGTLARLQAHRREFLGGRQTNEFVHFRAQDVCRLLRRSRDRKHDPLCVRLTQRLNPSTNRGSRGDAVIDDDHRSLGRFDCGSSATIQQLSAFDLL